MRRTFSFLLLIVLAMSCASVSYNQKDITESGLFTKIPVHLSEVPEMEVEIEGRNYCLAIDTGSSCDLALNAEFLEKISSKNQRGIRKYFDISGNSYVNEQFFVPEIKMHNMTFSNVVVVKENEQFRSQTKFRFTDDIEEENLTPSQGRVGNNLFRSFDCFFDFPHSAFYLAKDISESKSRSLFRQFIRVPFEIEESGLIVLSAKIDLGIKRFVLDTGSSVSILKKSLLVPHIEGEFPPPGKPMLKIKKLVINRHNFGSWQFCVIEFGENLDHVDGILGLDFFMKHAVYLDFKNNLALISP